MKLLVLFLYFILSFDLFAECREPMSKYAEAGSSLDSITRKFQKKYSKKEDTKHLVSIVSHPVKFYEEMRSRFDAQKKITPDDPQQFDYFDVMEVELKTMLKKMKVTSEQMDDLLIESAEELSSLLSSNYGQSYFRIKKLKKRIEEIEIGQKYISDLMAEASVHLSKRSISYRRSNEISYFYSRVNGYFDRIKMKKVTKLLLVVEEHIQGYKKLSMKGEYQLYKSNEMNWKRRRSKFVSAFNWSTDLFREAYENKNKLEFVLIPSHAHFGQDVFNRLLHTRVHILGLTTNPIGADGFLRPGGLFWLHDLRHSVLIHMRMLAYIKLNSIDSEVMKKLMPQIDKWYVEIDEASKLIEDDVLRKVTRRLLFNLYHDRGYPIVPSSIKTVNRHYTMDALFHLLERTGHGVRMEIKSNERIPEALEWLRDFWESKHELEEEILGSSPISVDFPEPKLFGK